MEKDEFINLLRKKGFVVKEIYGVYSVPKILYSIANRLGLSAKTCRETILKYILRKFLFVFDKNRWYRKILSDKKYYRWIFEKNAINENPDHSKIILVKAGKK